MIGTGAAERRHTIVIGAGQAGLSVGYHLARRGIDFLILEGNSRVGDSWRKRWDSLRLFSPARFNGLAGLPFPAPPHSFPTKDEMGDYLESYAAHFQLPVRTNARVERVWKKNGHFLVRAGGQNYEADNVVVAMASYQQPVVPALARLLDPAIVQLHSAEYRNPAQLKEGGVLIVGAGNSGAEIGVEVARTHRTWISGRDVGHVPFRIAGTAARLFLAKFTLRFLFHHVMTVSTPVGRKVRPKLQSQGGPLVRTRPMELEKAGIERVPRVTGVRNGQPLLADERVLDVSNVIWCTGFHPGFSWIDLPVFDQKGVPIHERGVVGKQPGLYFVGLNFLYAASSTMIHGVGRDAEFIVQSIATRPAKTEERQTVQALAS